ncbi:hypothetical protein Hanom_Chr04g00293751 [Helianthus anomalus]
MHHVVGLIVERPKGTCTNRSLSRLLSVICLCPRLNAKLLLSQGSYWNQPLYSYGVEVRVSTSYPPKNLPLICYWWDLLSMMMTIHL